MARSRHRKGSIPFAFVAVPMAVLKGNEWRHMSDRARVLMFDLMAQYTGKNNGRLSPSLAAMRERGWTSCDQLAKAKAELLACPFAIETRKGRPPRTGAWVGFTWWPLDWQDSMDIGPTGWPYLDFGAPLADALTGRNDGRDKAKRKTNPTIRHADRWSRKPAPIDPPHGSMEART